MQIKPGYPKLLEAVLDEIRSRACLTMMPPHAKQLWKHVMLTQKLLHFVNECGILKDAPVCSCDLLRLA